VEKYCRAGQPQMMVWHMRIACEILKASKVQRGTLDKVGDQRNAPAALSPGMTRYQLYRRLGGPPALSGRIRFGNEQISSYNWVSNGGPSIL
jgi:hypothetical protein